ncbi:antitoxin [Streptomyces sp. TRM64462]|uniref:antitoxin n=1 Tax=Streptomyces sp. TRM64462 TaxID=2741726 RepID=UPI001586E4D6|nr:antitoxin [Streptomyces sp. TRM64462]
MFDSLKNLKDKAEDLAANHGETIAQGLEKAGDLIDEKTDGKYSERIGSGVDKAQELVERLGEKKSAD